LSRKPDVNHPLVARLAAEIGEELRSLADGAQTQAHPAAVERARAALTLRRKLRVLLDETVTAGGALRDARLRLLAAIGRSEIGDLLRTCGG